MGGTTIVFSSTIVLCSIAIVATAINIHHQGSDDVKVGCDRNVSSVETNPVLPAYSVLGHAGEQEVSFTKENHTNIRRPIVDDNKDGYNQHEIGHGITTNGNAVDNQR